MRGSKKVDCLGTVFVWCQVLSNSEMTKDSYEKSQEVHIKPGKCHTNHKSDCTEYTHLSLEQKGVKAELLGLALMGKTPKGLNDWKVEELKYYWNEFMDAAEGANADYPPRFYQLLSLTFEDCKNVCKDAKRMAKLGPQAKDDAESCIMLVTKLGAEEEKRGRQNPFLYLKLAGQKATVPEWASAKEQGGQAMLCVPLSYVLNWMHNLDVVAHT